MTESITVERIAAMDLHPGDTLVISVAAGTSAQRAYEMRNQMKAWMDEHHPGCDVVAVPYGMELSVVRPVGEV